MVSNSLFTPNKSNPLAPTKHSDILQTLINLACAEFDKQLDPFVKQLSLALIDGVDSITDGQQAQITFNAGKLLKNQSYAFQHLATACMRSSLEAEVSLIGLPRGFKAPLTDEVLTLVPFDTMERKLQLDRTSRPLEVTHGAILSRLNSQLATLLRRDEITTNDNPFRPAVFIAALDIAWREFHPQADSHYVMLQQIESGMLPDISTILKSVEQTLNAAGITPRQTVNSEFNRSAKNASHDPNQNSIRSGGARATRDPVLIEQLRQLFNATPLHAKSTNVVPDFVLPTGFDAMHPGASVISPALSAYLTELQGRAATSMQADTNGGNFRSSSIRLSDVKECLAQDSMSRADETTVDVMSRLFEAVFRDSNIAQEMKDLISYLQIPVLKAALLDKEFFFEEQHPARRLLHLLTKSSLGWDSSKGRSDPLYRTIEHYVGRVQQFDSEMALFSSVLADLEGFLNAQEIDTAAQLTTPINHALKQEKLLEATRCATSDVASRVVSGEITPFLETFLENRWVPVLALGYSLKQDKPQVLERALRTMDELIWSVQPKITPQHRRELVTKLPLLLTELNKWLDLLKWNDAERLDFFAELAECHASIVRAPIELSPQRQLELAVESAQRAAERRLHKEANSVPVETPDTFAKQVMTLERGMWFDFLETDDSPRRLKLAWVSPLRSLFIFTTVERQEAFSLSTEALAAKLRNHQAKLVEVDEFVDRALAETISQSSDQIESQLAAH